jgi:hypothetical protein
MLRLVLRILIRMNPCLIPASGSGCGFGMRIRNQLLKKLVPNAEIYMICK